MSPQSQIAFVTARHALVVAHIDFRREMRRVEQQMQEMLEMVARQNPPARNRQVATLLPCTDLDIREAREAAEAAILSQLKDMAAHQRSKPEWDFEASYRRACGLLHTVATFRERAASYNRLAAAFNASMTTVYEAARAKKHDVALAAAKAFKNRYLFPGQPR